MQRLAFHLREKLKDAESIAELVPPVFREVRYLNAAEMYAVKEQIGKLEEYRRRISAGRSVRICWSITACIPGGQPLPSDPAKPQSGENRASVLCRAYWSNMAGAYGRMFLFREAADCLWQSYEMVRPMRCTAVIWQFCRCICRKKTIKSVSKS